MHYTDSMYGAHCPHCGSKDYFESRISISDLGYPIDNVYKQCKCKECKKEFNIKLRENRVVSIHLDPRCSYYADGMNMEIVTVPPIEISNVDIQNEQLKIRFEQALIFSEEHKHFRQMLEHFIDLLDESMRVIQ